MNPPKSFQVSRRSFLHRCGAAAAATGLPLWFIERELARAAEPGKVVAPNDRPGIALIGSGGMGQYDTLLASNFGHVVAVSDVDQTHVEQGAKHGKVPHGYSDFRKLLENKDVHVIINGCPDHWHSLVNIAAAKAQKDIYLSNDHMGNLFDCMRSRKDPICAVEIGHRSATVCHLGAISLRTGLKLQWDQEKEEFTGEHAKEGNAHVAREMRKPYDHSFVS